MMKALNVASFLAIASIAQTTVGEMFASTRRAAAIAAALTLQQPKLPVSVPRPTLRDLEYGDINFLHTTDTHGWHAGHLLEPSYNANWGDYISFSERLRTKLEANGKDLLVIDTGDRIEGNGLYDASEPRGKYTFGIFDQQQIDLLCIGNHELYKNTSAEDDYTKLVPTYKDNYIASNLKILDPKSGKLQPFSNLYRKFTTKNGIRILAFGFIFDFTRNDKNTVVTPVEVAIKEPWFQDAIKANDIDLIVVIGHVALRQMEFENVHKEIRGVNSTVPIQFFGGHFHIRDYRVFDDKSHALASGRFMETIGFQSISNLKSGRPKFFRRYIDNNLYSFMHHSNTTEETFHTERGLATTKKIDEARKALDLDKTFGYAPQTYWMSQVPFNDSSSVFTLLTQKVFPDIIRPARSDRTRMIITNTGAIRFDIFAGPFTRDSTFIVSPFTSNLSYIPDVPYRLAKQILPILNNGNPQVSDTWKRMHYAQRNKLSLGDLASPEEQARRLPVELPDLMGFSDYELFTQRREQILAWQEKAAQAISISSSADLTPGYTTHDDLGSDGDDTPHSTIPVFAVPNCIQAVFPGPTSSVQATEAVEFKGEIIKDSLADDEKVDLIFNAFLTPYIVKLLNLLPFIDNRYHGDLSYDHEEYIRNAAWSHTSWRYIDQGDNYWGENMDKYRGIDLGHVHLGLHEDLDPPHRERVLVGAMAARDEIDCSEEELQERIRERSKPRLERPVWSESDVQNYVPGETFTTLLARWVSENWGKEYEQKDTLQQGNPEL